MRLVRLILPPVLALALACGGPHRDRPETASAGVPATPVPTSAAAAKRDLRVRWIGLPSGTNAVWITTSDDGMPNGRRDGVDLVIDPGTPADVESTLIPALIAGGLRPGAKIAHIVVTTGEADRIAGANRLARHVVAKSIVSPEASPGRGAREAPLPYFSLGAEVSATVVRPGDAKGIPAQALLVRFIDTQFLFLPALPGSAADHFARAVGAALEARGVHPTLVSSDTALAEVTVAALETEAIAGPSSWADSSGTVVHLPPPAAGAMVTLETNGSEARVPGPLFRSRYGHWIECTASAECGATLVTSPSGPTLVKMGVAGRPDAWFLVDTRSPYSYLSRAVFESIPGWESAETHGHGHGGGAIGLAVPAFRLGGLGVRRWHVLPIEAFTIGDTTVDGVIGLDLLQSFRLVLSPRADRLALTPNFDEPVRMAGVAQVSSAGATGAGESWDVPMDRSPSGPLILATVDGLPKSLIVDLASAETAIYLNADELAKRVARRAPRTHSSFTVADDIADAGWKSLSLEAGAFEVKDLNLFGAHFSGVSALAVDRPLKADVLGLDFFEQFETVQLDFRRKSLSLRR